MKDLSSHNSSASVAGCLPTKLFFAHLRAQLSSFTRTSSAELTSPIRSSRDKHEFNKTEYDNRCLSTISGIGGLKRDGEKCCAE